MHTPGGFHYIIYMEIDIEEFWMKVKFLIKTHKTSQENIARLIGIPFGTFRNWMYHGRSPDLQIAVHLSMVLGVTLDYLVFNKDTNIIEEQQNRLLERKDAAAEINKLAKIIVDESTKI